MIQSNVGCHGLSNILLFRKVIIATILILVAGIYGCDIGISLKRVHDYKGCIVLAKNGKYRQLNGHSGYQIQVQNNNVIEDVYITEFDYNKINVGDTIR